MELNHLKYFYVVAREGGFTKAAKVLRVQQPAISKMVKLLEDNLGVVLLERLKRETRLTQAGEEVYRQCASIFETVEAIESFLEREQNDCHGPIRFGASDSVATHLVPDILKGFMKDYPEIRPSIFTGTSSMICEEVLKGRVEFGIFFTMPENEGFEVKTIKSLPFKCVISATRAGDLSTQRSFIGSRDVDYPKSRSFPAMEMLRAQKIRPETVIACNNLDAHRRMVLNGMGTALLPEFMVRQDLSSGRLAVLFPHKKFSYTLKLVTRKGKVLSRNAHVFLEKLRAEI